MHVLGLHEPKGYRTDMDLSTALLEMKLNWWPLQRPSRINKPSDQEWLPHEPSDQEWLPGTRAVGLVG